MRARGAAIQGGLAALGLIAAYTTWQREPERAPGEATVIDAGKNDVVKIRFDGENGKWVELEPKSDADGPAVWMRVAPRPDAKPHPTPERLVRGNEGAQKLLEKFEPLHATRALGTLEAAKLKELGLDAPKKKLTVALKGQTRVFDVGISPYGVSDPYVKDQKDGRVYVLGGGVLSDLDAASIRLVDRSLHAWKPADWDGLTITVGSKKRELTQTNAETPMQAKLVGKKSGKPDEMAKNWHDKIWRLVVTDVLGQGETPKDGAPQPVLKLEYSEHGKAKGFVELGRVTPLAPANTSMPPPVPEVYARSEHTAGWVKLAGNPDDLLKEADKVVAGE